MRVAHRDDIRVRFMHGGMQDETRLIDRIVSFDHSALVVRQNQIRHLTCEKWTHIGFVQYNSDAPGRAP